MSYAAKVLADSISPSGHRLFTLELTFPRFILAEVNTHRVFSRNSASSRAIPPERIIEEVEANPFVPETFNERVKGMGVGTPLDKDRQVACREQWLHARDESVMVAKRLAEWGIDKSRVNRLLEPFMWHTAIVSSTEWDNYFALRSPPGNEVDIDFPAQLEFQKIALAMREAMLASEPRELDYGEWHLPLVTNQEIAALPEEDILVPYYWQGVSAGRCARVSYLTHNKPESPDDSYSRHKRLKTDGHLSPLEHQACPDEGAGANFRGWMQYRERIPNQRNLVGHLEGRDRWDGSLSV